MDLTPLLSSAVVAALVAALVTLRTTERRIQIENITQERAKWRDKIRANALLVHKAAIANDVVALSEFQLAFALLLNPQDVEDNAILRVLERFRSTQDKSSELTEFTARVAHLLKHDWDRAKAEAKPWWFFAKATERIPYDRASA
jgi:hypothetical protein